MNDKLQILLNQIHFPQEKYSYFENGKLQRIVGNNTKDTYHFEIELSTTLPVEIYKEFQSLLKEEFHQFKMIDTNLHVSNPDENKIQEYYQYFLIEYQQECPLLEMFQNIPCILKGEILTLEVGNLAEKMRLKSISDQLKINLQTVGYPKLEINIDVNSTLNEDLTEEIQKSLEIELPKVTPKPVPEQKNSFPNRTKKRDDNPDVVTGRTIDTQPTTISNILSEEDSITVEAYVFGVDYFESSKSNFKIITLKITDYTDSMYCKVFVKDDDEYARLKKTLKEGNWFLIRGYTKNDIYSKEIVLNVRDINILKKEKEVRKDNAPVKRVELHAHTMMSQMDSVTKLDLGKHSCELISQAKKWGHRAVAITDHNCVQAFPVAYDMVKGFNKNLEEGQEPFKVLYGTELTLIDDTVRIVVRPTELPLLETTYVVFDFETTGFNAGGGDTIIEVGAVKILNGEIIDRFDELIDPGRKLPAKITEITNITDEMLKGKPKEEEVIKRFITWFGDLPMVAHNAKFDTSFLEMCYQKYNLGTFTNTVIDTLELSRTLDSNFGRHSLSALVKRYEVPWDEDAHHRADYDAEGTALVYHKMMKKLVDRNIETIDGLNKMVSKEEIHKFGRSYHMNILAKNRDGLKNLFKIVSLANTKYLYKTPRILRSEIEKLRDGLLIGSGCYESEVFTEARSKSDEELTNIMNFYDYIEVQPPEVYDHLIQMNDFGNQAELLEHLKKIIRVGEEAGKIVVATGDVHHLNREDKVYREIIVNQKVPGGGRHPLARNNITSIPSQHFRTTEEMLEDFRFLEEETAYRIVVTNTNKIADMIDIIEVIIETGGVPFSPKIENSVETVTQLVYDKAREWYGDPLPYNIEERIAKELYGDGIFDSIKAEMQRENYDAQDFERESFARLFKAINGGFENVKDIIRKNIAATEPDLSVDELEKKLKKTLGGIIGGGFDVIYLIAQKLVKKSNDDGYLVGSRGSVGSSFVATMMGITEVNPLPAHYRCPECKHSVFAIDGEELGSKYSSGFDLPDYNCPKCNAKMIKDGNDMPFATFLGFNADKVPDIDLNFSDLNQADAHEYTKVLFGVDNVYRAGTIGTVADKTAFGYVKGYCEDKGITMRTAEIERLAMGCTGVKRTTGQHPGGIVVIPDYMEVFDFTPFQFPADDPTSPWRTTHFDYHAIENDVLKLDILGHSDPTQLRIIQDLSGQDVTKVPLDDKETMGIFLSPEPLGVTKEQIMCETGTLGIPEFGTPFTVGLVAETKPTTFAELIKISGLSHGTDVWLGNAQELIRNKVVPFKEVIGCRDDIMVYLMYKGMKPLKAFKIMEFVRKGKASKDPETWAGFEQEMKEAGIDDWFIQSCKKIKYMFPKAHATAYVTSAFRIAYYKVHFPSYYYASWFSTKATDFDIDTMMKGYDAIKEKVNEIINKGYDASNKEAGILECLRVALEMTARGLKIGPIDLNRSKAFDFSIDDDNLTLIPPFRAIDGLGDMVAKKIIEEREKCEFLSIEDLQKRGKVSGTLIEKMRAMGILDGMEESSQLSLF